VVAVAAPQGLVQFDQLQRAAVFGELAWVLELKWDELELSGLFSLALV
jgi:hypothetical protein